MGHAVIIPITILFDFFYKRMQSILVTMIYSELLKQI